ncbi:threonylcarbamoyl-AMP synthase [candidate division KSB1 bacterium]|nr:MAG: threonylcarbamoyl-AMP synthase [candidate division KSB1 bacterium]
MRQIELTPDNTADVVRIAVESIRSGDLVLFPTDTVFGLGGLAFSRQVLEKLKQIKPERSEKPTAVLIDNIIRMSQCAGDVPSPRIVALTEAFWPGPLTLIWKISGAIPREFHPPDHSMGYRIPDYPFLNEVLRELESPLWATSANLSGQPSPKLFSEIKPAVLEACDLVIQTSHILKGKSSTVVDVRGRGPIMLRESAIREDDIKQVWKRV